MRSLGYREAANRTFALASEARRRRLTGVALKEDRAALPDGRAEATYTISVTLAPAGVLGNYNITS